MGIPAFLIRIVKPLQSRKMRVAITTVAVAYAAEYGLGLSAELMMTILGVGVALILGIAHEDNGVKQGTGGLATKLALSMAHAKAQVTDGVANKPPSPPPNVNGSSGSV